LASYEVNLDSLKSHQQKPKVLALSASPAEKMRSHPKYLKGDAELGFYSKERKGDQI